jgi:hypothetical protein
MTKKNPGTSRRDFIKSAAILSGGLPLLGASIPNRSEEKTDEDEQDENPYSRCTILYTSDIHAQ